MGSNMLITITFAIIPMGLPFPQQLDKPLERKGQWKIWGRHCYPSQQNTICRYKANFGYYVDKSSKNVNSQEYIENEILFMSYLSTKMNSMIPDYYGWYEVDNRKHLYMEHCTSDCLSTTIKNQVLFANRLTLIINRLHSLDIVHRDIKPDNIYYCKDSNGNMMYKLADLEDCSFTKTNEVELTGTAMKGTKMYAAPEVLDCLTKDCSYDVKRADYYAFGATLGRLFKVGYRPLTMNKASKVEINRVYRCYTEEDDEYWKAPKRMNKDLVQYIKILTHCDPDKRQLITINNK